MKKREGVEGEGKEREGGKVIGREGDKEGRIERGRRKREEGERGEEEERGGGGK